MWIYLNDRFVDDANAMISVFDHGLLYGDGVYETIRSYGDQIFMRDEHLDRLRRSADAIGLRVPVAEDDWPALLNEAMQRNDVGNEQIDAYIRITLSRGVGDIGLDPALCPTPTVIVMTKPLSPPPPHQYQSGVDLIVAKTRRNYPGALDPQIKSTSFLNNILAKREAIAAQAFDSLLLNWESHLAECTVSNLFFVTNGRLRTPSLACGILDGITRRIILSLAREEAIRVEEGAYTLDQLVQADECFLTNTTMEVMPVTSVNRGPLGTGKPGPLTRRLHQIFVTNRPRFLQA
ncbi:putative Aminodeoxychorismate lyase [Nitrospira japonica]|uniref:branched-chain-amino-acid transaminase n=1 Tax=Nitrospira japonica TaxID=1325564 RepID=A0A1W1I0Z1_9BACT|nr:aminotransferase class IV [Nitrospira japonica]SLM46668.1 putative Aminodeoxychorismate lyase [Nitrospira japonica]